MTMQKLLSKTRQAINDFNMINDNDKIAVGLSGGKDSVTLLHILKNYQKFSPQKFELIMVHYMNFVKNLMFLFTKFKLILLKLFLI